MPTVFQITYDDLIKQLRKQKGKCKYTGINMSFDGSQPFHISLERINVNIGYTTSNIIFICQELNSPDFSSMIALHGLEKKEALAGMKISLLNLETK